MKPNVQALREKVKGEVRKKCFAPPPDPALPVFTRHFQERFGEHLLAVILYGSCLSEITRRNSSIYDFFLICDGYRPFYRDLKLAALNAWLPPSGYYVKFEDPRLGTLAGKYCVTSLPHFRRETSPQAGDIYHLGRFAKRVAVLYARDDEVRERLVEGLLGAMERNLAFTLPFMPERFHQNELILTLLSMSYRGETRIDVDTKVEEIFRSESEYYRFCYGNLFRAHCLARRAGSAVEESLSFPMSRARRGSQGLKVRLTLSKNRFRAYLRWPKHVITFTNWVDYLLSKVERSKGIRIELTERERKYPLIFGWKYFFQLKREGKIR